MKLYLLYAKSGVTWTALHFLTAPSGGTHYPQWATSRYEAQHLHPQPSNQRGVLQSQTKLKAVTVMKSSLCLGWRRIVMSMWCNFISTRAGLLGVQHYLRISVLTSLCVKNRLFYGLLSQVFVLLKLLGMQVLVPWIFMCLFFAENLGVWQFISFYASFLLVSF